MDFRMKRAGVWNLSSAASTLLFELALTRIFSVLFYHHFAFLIISTALFGFGLSGLYLFLRPTKRQQQSPRRSIVVDAFFFTPDTITIKLILILPYGFQEVYEEPVAKSTFDRNVRGPCRSFFCAGCAISLILRSFRNPPGACTGWISWVAALGCLAVLWLVPILGGQGTIVASSVLAAVAALAFWPRYPGGFVAHAAQLSLPLPR